jgi:hypothetical protein
LIKRFISVDEVVAIVTYISSELSSATTGAPRCGRMGRGEGYSLRAEEFHSQQEQR